MDNKIWFMYKIDFWNQRLRGLIKLKNRRLPVLVCESSFESVWISVVGPNVEDSNESSVTRYGPRIFFNSAIASPTLLIGSGLINTDL